MNFKLYYLKEKILSRFGVCIIFGTFVLLTAWSFQSSTSPFPLNKQFGVEEKIEADPILPTKKQPKINPKRYIKEVVANKKLSS